MITEQELLSIDDRLRFTLFGLECALNAEFNVSEVECIFADAENGGVSEKRYTLWQGRHQTVTARVDEHEPSDVWVRVESRKPFELCLAIIKERAKYQVYRLGD
jgi:hypothetical protein